MSDQLEAERPRLRIGPFSEFYHFYLTPLMFAQRDSLTIDSIPRIPEEDDAPSLLVRFTQALKALGNAPTGSGHAIRRVTLSLLFPRFHLIAIWQLFGLASDGAMPFLIAEIVKDMRVENGNVGRRFGYVAGLGTLCLVNTAALQQVLWNGSRCGMRAKIGLAAAVYDKMMRLELGVASSWSSAEVSNVIAIDLMRLELAAMFGHFIWSTPTCLLMCAVLSWIAIGVSALPGILFLVLLIAAQSSLGWRIAALRNRVAAATDARVKLMQDILLGSAALKVNAWEEALQTRLHRLRAVEHRDIAASLHILTTIEAAIFFAPGVATFGSLLFRRYVFAPDEPLQVEQGFLVLSIFAVLVKQLNIFPRAVKTFDEQLISFRRVERFLMLPEVEAPATEKACSAPIPGAEPVPGAEPISGSGAVGALAPRPEAVGGVGSQAPMPSGVGAASPFLVAAEAACGVWGGGLRYPPGLGEGRGGAAGEPTAAIDAPAGKLSSPEPNSGPAFSLGPISLHVAPGELHMLCGQIGCGKSSVLQLLLGEMRLRSGTARVTATDGGGIGYVPQTAWTLNASFRDNILMGRQFDAGWYKRVVRCCALEQDQARIGDETQIGERGVTVSGGQRARLSLARALYGRPAVFLLDDPLSAVDAHVAAQLVEECLLGEIKAYGAAVVLASHQVHLAAGLATRVYLMEEGRIVDAGTPAELVMKGLLPAEVDKSLLPQATSRRDSEAVGAPHPGGASGLAATGKEKGAAASPPGGWEGEGTVSADEPAPPPEDEGGANGAEGVAEAKDVEMVEVSSQGNNGGQGANGVKGNDGAAEAAAAATGPSAAEMGRGSTRRAAALFFIHAMGGASLVLPVLLLVLCLAACRALSDWSLGEWVRNGTQPAGAVLYAALIGGTVVSGLVQGAAVVSRMLGASSRIHDEVLHRVLRAPKAWLDATPHGLVLAIFSKDQDTLDDLLPATLVSLVKCIIIVSTALTLGIIAVPAVLLLLPLVYYLFRRLTTFYQRTASQLKRLDKATTGPIISRFAETFSGLSSVRALRLQKPLGDQLLAQLSANNTTHFLWTASGRWLAVRLDWVATSVVVAVGCGVVGFHLLGVLTPSLAGLSLVYILQITSLFQWGFRTYAELQNHFVSVERAMAYTQIPQEPAATLPADAALAADAWPQRGSVRFANVCMRYRPELPLALHNLTLEIEPGLKSALVGRTGAGKSSITVALFRLVELQAGHITIDGVDIATIGLRCLRRAMATIQQEAILFSGTLRSNLDPLDQVSDAKLHQALDKVDFRLLTGGSLALHTQVSDGGVNLSAGTRQLLMLARAMLTDARILVMDEATANCDGDTDATMQRAVRSHFGHATILTVAHRLDTIIDYDRIFVMEAGAVVEAGTPAQLLGKEGSRFGGMCAEAGIDKRRAGGEVTA